MKRLDLVWRRSPAVQSLHQSRRSAGLRRATSVVAFSVHRPHLEPRRLSMRMNLLTAALAITAAVSTAQQKGAPPPPKMFTSSAEIQDLIAKSRSQRKEGQAIVTQRILSLAPYNANMEYR